MTENKRYKVAIYDENASGGYCVLDVTKRCADCFKYEYHKLEDGDYIRICKYYDETKNLENNPHNEFKKWDCPYFERMSY